MLAFFHYKPALLRHFSRMILLLKKMAKSTEFKIEMIFANSHTSAYIFINVYFKSIGNNLVMKDERKILSIQKYDIIRKFHENNSELALGQELKHENRCSKR